MKTLKKVSLITLLWLFYSCNISPKAINYGADGCHYCKMTIVETTHAAQIVTKKGKPYKYDAIECLLNDFEKNIQENINTKNNINLSNLDNLNKKLNLHTKT